MAVISPTPGIDFRVLSGGQDPDRPGQPWKRHRRVFDRLVDLQRALGVRRRVPEEVVPSLGLQWWCLSLPTLRALLGDPRLPGWRRYFRRCWIPDESFFQTLVPLVAAGEVDRRSLTLQRFDADGRPVVFHDDHRELLEGADHFLARKIDPDAGALYARFLRPGGPVAGEVGFRGAVDETPFEAARARAREEGRGLPSAARLPEGHGAARVKTERPYAVLVSSDPAALKRLRDGLRTGVRGAGPVFHGRLFGPRPAEFAVPGDYYTGKLPGAPRLRDYRPAQFLARLVWADRDRAVAFLLVPADNALVAGQVLGDPNARLLLLGDGPGLLGALEKAAALPVTRRAWWRAADPADPASLGAVLAADWRDRAGWTDLEGSA